MRIKLILAAEPDDPLRKLNPFMPLSLAILAGSAPNHEYELVDMLWEAGPINFDDNVDLVGISMRKSAEQAAFRLADEFRKRNIKVVLGGPQASANPIESRKHADVVVIGEGELLWPRILDDIQNDKPKDFYVSAPNAFSANGYKVFQLDNLPKLDKLKKPNRNLFKRKYDFDMVFASRGCAINCDFCSVSRLFGTQYRFRPVDEVVEDIRHFKNYYYLIDDTVFGRATTYDYYLELYDKLAKQKKVKYWTGQANLDAASKEKGREVIKKAAKAGLIYAAIGMESINEAVLKKSGSYSKMGAVKGDNMLEKMKENIRFIQDQGILISAWFAIGYEGEGIETYYDTFEFCKEMNLIPVFTPVHAMQGTDLYDRMNLEGKLRDNQINLTNISHPTMEDSQVVKALDYVNKNGLNLWANLKRSLFYFKKFKNQKGNTVNDIIHKTIFTFIAQKRFAKISKLELKKLSKKINKAHG